MSSMRSVASATISFGMVSIPVKAYLTASAESISFSWLTPDGNRVKQKLVDADTGEEVERCDVKHGYEYEKDKFIPFSSEELSLVSGEKDNVIEITEFNDRDNVDIYPTKIERTLYLTPDKSDKSYRLLHNALVKRKRVAVAKWYTKGKDHLVVLEPRDSLIIMLQLYYVNELRDLGMNFAVGSEPTPHEEKLALSLVDHLTNEEFDLSVYRDEYKARLETVIQAKLSGGRVTSQKLAAGPESLTDLLAKSLKNPKKTKKSQ